MTQAAAAVTHALQEQAKRAEQELLELDSEPAESAPWGPQNGGGLQRFLKHTISLSHPPSAILQKKKMDEEKHHARHAFSNRNTTVL